MSKVDNHTYRLIIHCPDKVGIVAAVSQFIADHNGWLLESNYHADPDSDWFFMRNELKASSLSISLDEFREKFSKLGRIALPFSHLVVPKPS
jgi:formyltetrahydrofolate deformylase